MAEDITTIAEYADNVQVLAQLHQEAKYETEENRIAYEDAIAEEERLRTKLEDAVDQLNSKIAELSGVELRTVAKNSLSVASVVEPELVVNTPAPAPEPKWIEIISLEGLAELEAATVAIPTGATFFAHEGNYYIFANANKERVGI